MSGTAGEPHKRTAVAFSPMDRYPDMWLRLANCAYGASPATHTVLTREVTVDEADTRPRLFTLPDRARIAQALHAHGLGLVRLPGITTITPICHGNAHGCTCPEHSKPKPATAGPAQPWDPRPLKRAA